MNSTEHGLRMVIGKQKIAIAKKNYILKHYKLRLKKIRNSMDYLLQYPYSIDCGTKTRKMGRDIPRNQKHK